MKTNLLSQAIHLMKKESCILRKSDDLNHNYFTVNINRYADMIQDNMKNKQEREVVYTPSKSLKNLIRLSIPSLREHQHNGEGEGHHVNP